MITPTQRHKASRDLTLYYLSTYYPHWRLAKVLSLKKIYDNRYDFYSGIIHTVKQEDDDSGELTIAQEIRNGLYFDATATCIQYIEDLFAFIKATQQPDYFIKNIINYKSTQVAQFIREFTLTSTALKNAFHFADRQTFVDPEVLKHYDTGSSTLQELVQGCINFYKRYSFIYNQYKHGLTVAMRTFGKVLTSRQLENDKQGKNKTYLLAYDSDSLETSEKKKRLNSAVILPGLTDNITPFINDLQKEGNWLRLVISNDAEFEFDDLVDMAYQTRCCINILIANYTEQISTQTNTMNFLLPSDYLKSENFLFTYNLI